MNPLPLRKKSPEELAKLRENFGIPVSPPALQAAEGRPSPATGPNGLGVLPLPSAMMPADNAAPQRHLRPQSRSFKRSEHRPQALGVTPSPAATEASLPNAIILGDAETKQEQAPARMPAPQVARPSCPEPSFAKPSTKSTGLSTAPLALGQLPLRRHSAQELAQARRRDAMAVMSQGAYQLPTAAHPVLLACGYLLAIGGAAAPTLLDWLSRLTGSYTLGMAWSHGYHLLTACTLVALVVAGVIFIRNSLSRHHASFIAIIGFFALVFALIHYFSQLRHAT